MLNNITFDKISDLTGQKGVEGVHLGGSVRVRDSINVLKTIKTGLLDVDNIRIDGNTLSSTDTDGSITFTDGNITLSPIADNLTVTGENPGIWIKNDTINQDDSGHLDFTEDDSAFNTDGGYGFRIQLLGDTPNGKAT